MPFVLLIAGAVLLTSAVRNTQDDLFSLVKGDFTGQQNFIYWFLAIFTIGAIGYIPKAKPISTSFLVLVVLVLVLTRGNPNGKGGGFFAQFTNQIQTAQVQTAPGASPGPVLQTVQGPPVDLSLPENLFSLPIQ
jgi:hypothetical protein